MHIKWKVKRPAHSLRNWCGRPFSVSGNLTVLFCITRRKTVFSSWFGIPGLALIGHRLTHPYVRILLFRESGLFQWDITS